MAFATLLLAALISKSISEKRKIKFFHCFKIFIATSPGLQPLQPQKYIRRILAGKSPIEFSIFFFDGFLNAFKLTVAGEKRGEGLAKIRAGFGLE